MEIKHKLNGSNVAWITIVSGIIAFISYFLVLIGIQFHFEVFSDPKSIFKIEGVNPDYLRWSMITDVFGYYLLLIPLAFYIYRYIRNSSEWSEIITFCGLSYILIGSIGASILYVLWPFFIELYPASDIAFQNILDLMFASFTKLVSDGLWNSTNAFLGGCWFFGIGLVFKIQNKKIGWFTIVLGITYLLDWFGNIVNLHLLSEIALNIYLIMAPVWAIIIGIALLKRKILN